jgi:hypothetical protein
MKVVGSMIAARTTPTGGAGVTGQLGTITRADGPVQVTYKGATALLLPQRHQAR